MMLDGAIAVALGWRELRSSRGHLNGKQPNSEVRRHVPKYSRSLDAALRLVPDGWRWVMRQANPDKSNPNERGFFARVATADFEAITWGKGECWITDHVAGQEAFAWAGTPALAMCAAALTAIATEARRAETQNSGSVHEGAGPKGIAQ